MLTPLFYFDTQKKSMKGKPAKQVFKEAGKCWRAMSAEKRAFWKNKYCKSCADCRSCKPTRAEKKAERLAAKAVADADKAAAKQAKAEKKAAAKQAAAEKKAASAARKAAKDL